MSIEIKVPPLPESVSDATLVAWHKKPGDTVSRDENIADLETDKVVLEVPAPASGTILKLKVKDGATVVAGDLLAILEEGDVAQAATAAPVAVDSVTEVAPAKADSSGESAHKLSPRFVAYLMSMILTPRSLLAVEKTVELPSQTSWRISRVIAMRTSRRVILRP